VPVTDKTIDHAIPLKGTVRAVEANKDHGALAVVDSDQGR